MYNRHGFYIIILLLSAHLFLFSKTDFDIQSGITAFENGNLEAAAFNFKEARNAFPDDPEPVFWLGRVELSQGNPGTAAEYFEDAVKLKDDHPECHYWLGTAIAANIYNVGRLRQLGHARRMRKAWQRAVELDPYHLDARFSLLEYYLQAPGIAGGGRDKAMNEVEEIKKCDKAAGRRAMIRVYLSDEEYEKAAEESFAGIKEFPEDINLRLETGNVFQSIQDWDSAYEQFRSILEIEPNNRMALAQIGRTAFLSDKYMEEGLEALGKFIVNTPAKNTPSLAWAYTLRGRLLAKTGNMDDARSHFETALALDENHEDARKALNDLEKITSSNE